MQHMQGQLQLPSLDGLRGPFGDIAQGNIPALKITVLKPKEQLIPLQDLGNMSVADFNKLYSVCTL